MALLGRDAILEADDVETVDVDVPEWGGTVRLKVLSGKDRDRFEESMAKVKNGVAVPDMVHARARLVAWSAVDEEGVRVFHDKDILKLSDKSAKPLQRLFDEACKLSGLTPEDVDKLTEGFTDGQSEDSTSA